MHYRTKSDNLTRFEFLQRGIKCRPEEGEPRIAKVVSTFDGCAIISLDPASWPTVSQRRLLDSTLMGLSTKGI